MQFRSIYQTFSVLPILQASFPNILILMEWSVCLDTRYFYGFVGHDEKAQLQNIDTSGN